MTKNTVNETERMAVTRVFDAPRELVWKAWTDPKYVMQWWGPNGCTSPFCEMDFRVGGKFLICGRMPVNTTRLFCTRRSFPPCTFPTQRGTRLTLRKLE